MSSNIKDFDFQGTIDFCRGFAMSLLKTDDLNIHGQGHVTLIQYEGAQEAAKTLLKISEQLARLHTILTQEAHSTKEDK
jgi:hypothetical protein